MENTNPYLGDSFFNSQYLNPDYLFEKGANAVVKFFSFSSQDSTIDGFYTFLAILNIIFLTFIAYCVVRMLEIRKKEHDHMHHEVHEYAHRQAQKEKEKFAAGQNFKNEKWNKVLEHLFSHNQNDWKLAIIEADTMLDELVTGMGFKGESLGEKLKSADRDKFRSLSMAWEAHAVRNRIAHEGLSFQLMQQEAKRVVALYEQIFREFGFI